MVKIRLRKGMTPIRSLRMSWASIDEAEVAWSGDGDEHEGIGLTSALYPDAQFLLHIDDMDQVEVVDEPRENEVRLGVRSDRGFVMDVNWQRPFIPWLRTHCYVVWAPAKRATGAPPVILRTREGRHLFLRIMEASRRHRASPIDDLRSPGG
ncbi:hypothetical protein ASC63_13525 [Leifsonia sp. Root112D2]|nr:hypothetical protein ASC63_13525 [Leifsonia sp. Root112D2]